ncbi:MAG TPA: NAD(P)-binding protein, partial [Candidatus Melainabacteria bacterium]|nr:NAD(P)-binding protein [Candidatus Melainabacteria bacterium]
MNMPKPSDSDDTRIKRSTFLKGIIGLTVAGVTGKFLYDRYNTLAHVPVRLLGPSMDFGHMVRDGSLKPDPNAPVSQKVKVLIIGGGIAGLSAGWWLKREGMEDFMLLELEGKTGGNSASGENHVRAYPRGAHYIPLANAESTYVRMLFQELGIIESVDAAGTATYNDLYLCHDPEERLFKDGSFQEGLVPNRGLRPEEKAEIERFFKVIVDFRNKTGSDGKPAFAIPLDLSSRDEEFRSLDRISMEQWLKQNNFSARPLLWYVDYCTRDDYGAKPADVSAWAGIHYFAGRRGLAANAEQNAVVTWPQGNGFVVQKLTEKLASNISTDACVFHIESRADSVRAAYIDRKSRKTFLIEADHLIFACPRFILPRVLKLDASGNSIDMDYVKKVVYPPWMVANITL